MLLLAPVFPGASFHFLFPFEINLPFFSYFVGINLPFLSFGINSYRYIGHTVSCPYSSCVGASIHIYMQAPIVAIPAGEWYIYIIHKFHIPFEYWLIYEWTSSYRS